MARFGLIGPSYQSQAISADAQRTINFYVERDESGQGKSDLQLIGTPGLSLEYALADKPVRGEITTQGRSFTVSGSLFYELLPNGAKTQIAIVANDSLPVSMAAGTTQILFASAGLAYVFNLATNIFTVLPNGTFAGLVSFVGYCDGFFLALIAGTNKVQVSGPLPLDATVWDLTRFIAPNVFVGPVLSMIVDHREVWLFGEKQTQAYFNSGAFPVPFDIVPGGFIEQGIGAVQSPIRLDNSVFWMGGDERGNGIFWRAQGYTPVRVSNHAVEAEWRSYGKISDMVGYTQQEGGHSFGFLYFPSAKKTWVYDAAMGMWHERAFWDAATGVFTAHRSQCHTFNFGKHLVGDWASGNIYNMSPTLYTDFGNPLRSLRRSPYISTEDKWTYFSQLQIDIEAGVGPQPPLLDGQGNPRAPQVMLSWFDGGSRKQSNEYPLSFGMAGEFRARAMKRILGRSRSRTFQIEITDPVPRRIVDAYLDATNHATTERLSAQLRKSA